MTRNCFMSNTWPIKRIKDLTLNDAMDAMSEGFYLICSDGKISYLTNNDEDAF